MRTRKYTDGDLTNAISSSLSVREVLKKLGKSQQGGGSYNQIRDDCKRLNLDISHFTGKGHLRGKRHSWNVSLPFSDLLVENSTYSNRTSLKKRLLKANLLRNECYICNQNLQWNGKPLVMVLDHKNGIRNDHRLDNLRLLCPNCNSQQPTFAGRNKKLAS